MFTIYMKNGSKYRFDMSGKRHRTFFGGKYKDEIYQKDMEFISNIKDIEITVVNKGHYFNIPENIKDLTIANDAIKIIKVGGGGNTIKDIAECFWYDKDDIRTKYAVSLKDSTVNISKTNI